MKKTNTCAKQSLTHYANIHVAIGPQFIAFSISLEIKWLSCFFGAVTVVMFEAHLSFNLIYHIQYIFMALNIWNEILHIPVRI